MRHHNEAGAVLQATLVSTGSLWSGRLPEGEEPISELPLDIGFIHDFLDRLLEAGRSRDSERVLALCTEDVTFEDAGEHRALHGRQELREMLTGIYGVVVELHLEIRERYMSLDGTRAGARWRATGTSRSPAGEDIEFETAEFYEFRDGLVSHWTFMARDLDWLGRQWGT